MAVEDGDTDLDLRNLPVEVPRHQAPAHQLDTVHPAVDTALAVVAAPSSPWGTAQLSTRNNADFRLVIPV